MDGVLNIFFIGINFIKYYITQTKLFKVKLKRIRLKKSKLDNYFGTEILQNVYGFNVLDYVWHIMLCKVHENEEEGRHACLSNVQRKMDFEFSANTLARFLLGLRVRVGVGEFRIRAAYENRAPKKECKHPIESLDQASSNLMEGCGGHNKSLNLSMLRGVEFSESSLRHGEQGHTAPQHVAKLLARVVVANALASS
ncbi:hypothetical protein LXL04_029469 [Taraxacum kok-saghyz]